MRNGYLDARIINGNKVTMLGMNPLPIDRKEARFDRACIANFSIYRCALGGLIQRLVLVVAVALGGALANGSEPDTVRSGPTVPTIVQSRVFELSTRHLSDHFCSINVHAPGFRVCEVTPCQLLPSTLEEAIPQDDVLTIIYVHGNFMSRETALERVRILDHRLKPHAKSDYRILMLSWPSQWEGKTIRDVYSNAECADDHSLYVAWLLYQLRAQSRVSLLGFSFGSRAITGGLHLDEVGVYQACDRWMFRFSRELRRTISDC